MVSEERVVWLEGPTASLRLACQKIVEKMKENEQLSRYQNMTTSYRGQEGGGGGHMGYGGREGQGVDTTMHQVR